VRAELECLPCFFSQVERTLRHAGVNGDQGRRALRQAGRIIEEASLDQAPARITTLIHRLLRDELRIDPYRSQKDQSTLSALAMLPALRERVRAASDHLEAGVRAAIAGNVIDFGIYDSFDLGRSVDESFRLPLPAVALSSFAAAVRSARRILYLCDNAGEIVFDRILLELLRDAGRDVIAVVKGSPVINDATREDAARAGLMGSVPVIDNGNDGIGTLLERCSPEFREAYGSADLIVSKGQANYETLASERDERTFFLFKVKCPVVAKALGRPEGDIVLMRSGEAATASMPEHS
jgi:uncharacterized protein with ATP-grasp and redox domains